MSYRLASLGTESGTLPSGSAATSGQARPELLPSGLTRLSPQTLASLPTLKSAVSVARASTPFQLIPPECAKIAAPKPVVGTVGANVPVVVAYPLVTLTDSQVASFLGHVYGDGGGGDSLIEVLSQWKAAKTIAEFPTLVASGWMRDTVSNQAKTRGVLWLAFAFPVATSAATIQRLVKAITLNALTKMGATTGIPSAGAVPGGAVAADGTSDQALQGAAMASAMTVVVLAEVFARIIGARTAVYKDAKTITQVFDTTVNKAVLAVDLLAAAPSALGQVDSVVAQAMAAPADQAATVLTTLQQTREALQRMKADIIAGVEAVPALEMEIANNDDPNGALAMRIRNEIVSDAQAEINKIDVSIGREWRKCTLYTLAQKQLDGYLRTVSDGFARGAVAASTLRNNTDAIAQVLAGIDVAIEKIRVAEQQVPLSWIERDFAGAPTYVWLGGGAVLFIGFIAVARHLKKKRRAAAAVAPAVTKNRRRRRSR